MNDDRRDAVNLFNGHRRERGGRRLALLARVRGARSCRAGALSRAVVGLRRAEAENVPDRVLAEAHEAVARAHAVTGGTEAARHHAEEARAIAATIEDDDDREVVLRDLATLPFG
jgi:hypothetical protein